MATQAQIPPLTVSNPWWGHDPSEKQLVALWAYEKCPNLFYGGAAGPGKTSFLLMAAVQYVHYPHYRALILRKTYADLSLPDAIMDRAISCWDGVEGARFNNQEKACYFPSGAKITFGYLASVRDHLRYQGAAVHFVGIDEASQIPSRQLEYLHSRIRRSAGDPIPLRYRLASNPGDVSHDWLKDTYVNGADGHSIVYLPGLMTDNPGLDVDEYRKQLAHLDPVTRKQLEEGDWDVQLSGGVLDTCRSSNTLPPASSASGSGIGIWLQRSRRTPTTPTGRSDLPGTRLIGNGQRHIYKTHCRFSVAADYPQLAIGRRMSAT